MNGPYRLAYRSIRGVVLSAVILTACAQVPARLPTAPADVPSESGCDAWADFLAMEYKVSAELVYRTASGVPLALDVYQPRKPGNGAGGTTPAIVFFHGGGWVTGDKNGTLLRFLPFLRLGYTVFTVNYRMVKEACAPAAVEDARYAVRWVLSRADKFRVDRDRIILTGTSAGGHLALMAGMLPVSAGLDHLPGSDAALGVSVADWWTTAPLAEIRVAAIVDFWGIADVEDLIRGPNARNWAIDWIGDSMNTTLATRMSPLTWVRPGLPPILMIHGDPDPLVPFGHSVRLKKALDEAGVENRLLAIPEGGHGDLNEEDSHRAWNAVREFLGAHDLLPR